MSESQIQWAGGGGARIVAVEADRVVLHSTVAHPPGSRVEGRVVALGVPLRIKVHGCRRQLEGDFELHGRLLDVTRAERVLVEGLVRGDVKELGR